MYRLVTEHDYQLLLCKDQYVWEILYLKLIIGLVIIMSTYDFLENSEAHAQQFHDSHISGARSSWIVICYPLCI